MNSSHNTPDPFEVVNPVKEEISRMLGSEPVDRRNEIDKDQVRSLHALRINSLLQKEGIDATCEQVIIWRDDIEAKLNVDGVRISVFGEDPK
jgi:hypothetical protein